jgi:glycosyltransferase involved in cell wall biosynthesis
MLNTVPPQPTPQAMAKLMVGYDVLVMPSHSKMWREPFGILSVEAQHAGCRVVASDIGGLPETDCGGLEVFEPENPLALAQAIRRAGKHGRLTAAKRQKAATHFTVAQSVDQLLDVLASDVAVYQPK